MTSDRPIPFAKPDIGESEIAAVVRALRSGWVTTGPVAREFEARFADLIGDDLHAVSVNSATAGLHLALEAAGIGPGDEVLVPTWTFTATAEVVRYLGATPVLVDVEPKTLNIDLSDARLRITGNTKAIMPVHFAGLAVDPIRLANFAREFGLVVVEDAAHAFPAHVDGLQVGARGSIATVFSFYATKTITTGEGGMVVTPDEGVANRMRTMRLHGISRDIFDRYTSRRRDSWRYEVVAPGFKYNLSDMAAAMGIAQLERAEHMRARREVIAHYYLNALASRTDLELPSVADVGSLHAWHLFVVRLPDRIRRDDFIGHMSVAGVGASVHFIPLHLHPYWQDLGGYTSADFPVASREFERVVSLPIYSSLTDDEMRRVVDVVVEGVR
jgi:dTDP-4-amino-4,6-dideoxygalactose transaminase